MTFLKICISTFFLSLIIDYLWVGILMHRFYDTELGSIGRRPNGVLNVHIPSVLLVYILLAIGITFFVIPLTTNASLLQTAGIGALFGLVIYGVYDFTNYGILASYSLKLLVVDVLWGTFLCGIVTSIVSIVTRKYL